MLEETSRVRDIANEIFESFKERRLPQASLYANTVTITSVDPTFSGDYDRDKMCAARQKEFDLLNKAMPDWKYDDLDIFIEEKSFQIDCNWTGTLTTGEAICAPMKFSYLVDGGVIVGVETWADEFTFANVLQPLSIKLGVAALTQGERG